MFQFETIRRHKEGKGFFNSILNIMKKGFPNAILVDGIEAFGLMPQILQHNIVDNSIWNKMSTVLLVLVVLNSYKWNKPVMFSNKYIGVFFSTHFFPFLSYSKNQLK